MIDLGLRLEQGGLCSMVPDFQIWEGQVLKAKEIGEFVSCFINLFQIHRFPASSNLIFFPWSI